MNDIIELPDFDRAWSDTIKEAYKYDRLEVGGDRFNAPYTEMYHQRQKFTLDAVQRHVPVGGRVLDLAAAAGNFSIALAKMGYQVTWNDLRDELVHYVRLKTPPTISLEFVGANIFELDGKFDSMFDAVVALEVIEHVAHPDEFLRNIAKLVKPGGPIIISTPNGGYFRNSLPRFSDFPDPSVFESFQFQPNSDGHIFLLYEDELRRFGDEAGLEMVEYFQFTNPLSAGHVKLRYLHKVLPISVIRMIEKVTQKLPLSIKAGLMSASLGVYYKKV